MPDFTQRSYDKELLDSDNIPFNDILRNMDELDIINSRLGGHAITRTGLSSILKKFVTSPNKAWLICEIGCGNGNNLSVLHKWCVSRKINANFIGIDINRHCIDSADTTKTGGRAKYIVSDYRTVVFDRKPDIIFSSLFSHHFTDEQLIEQLQWMKANSRNGFFINDLHRHPLAYHS
ncbi:MAG: methyltransferase domain-containing protein, partial [Chitinophagaceae bacterium]